MIVEHKLTEPSRSRVGGPGLRSSHCCVGDTDIPFSNREIQLLESCPTHCKQTTAIISNREFLAVRGITFGTHESPVTNHESLPPATVPSTRKWLSSRNVRNLLKANTRRASYPQMKPTTRRRVVVPTLAARVRGTSLPSSAPSTRLSHCLSLPNQRLSEYNPPGFG